MTQEAAPEKQPTAVAPRKPTLPAEERRELNGIQEFGLRNWCSFDAQAGKLVCRNLRMEFEEVICTILESRVVYVKKDADGNVLCASYDRVLSQDGDECAYCEDRGSSCLPRWWIAFQPVDGDLLFAHTLSLTGSTNFNIYANVLLKDGLLPSQAITRMFVEEAKRKKTHTAYRRLQFERLDA